MNETLIFVKILPLAFNTFIPMSFPLVEAPLKLPFRCSLKLPCLIYFNVLHILKSLTLKMSFKFKKKSHWEFWQI